MFTRVPVVGRVTLVAAVVVKVKAKFPEVVRLFAISILPASLIVLAALTTSKVKFLLPVNAVEEVGTKATSKFAEVSFTAKLVKAPDALVVAPILILLIVPTPTDVNARVGVLEDVSVMRFV